MAIAKKNACFSTIQFGARENDAQKKTYERSTDADKRIYRAGNNLCV